jgi:hypothetical protein
VLHARACHRLSDMGDPHTAHRPKFLGATMQGRMHQNESLGHSSVQTLIIMKNTFNLPRKKVNGVYPYVCQIDGKTKYLFELTKNTSFRQILHWCDCFEHHELIFATKDLGSTYRQVIDASNVYITARPEYPVYRFHPHMKRFYEIEFHKEFYTRKGDTKTHWRFMPRVSLHKEVMIQPVTD